MTSVSFAAGAMVFFVVELLVPELQLAVNTNLATVTTLLGLR